MLVTKTHKIGNKRNTVVYEKEVEIPRTPKKGKGNGNVMVHGTGKGVNNYKFKTSCLVGM